MRRTIYGIGLTLLWCVSYYLILGLSFGVLHVFFLGLSLSILWDVGVLSNIKATEKRLNSQSGSSKSEVGPGE